MDALKQVALQTGDFETQERLAERLALIHRRNDDLWMLQFAVEELAYADLARMRWIARSPGSRRRCRSTGGSATSATSRCTSRPSAARIAPAATTTRPSRPVDGRSTSPASWGTASGPGGRRRGSARR